MSLTFCSSTATRFLIAVLSSALLAACGGGGGGGSSTAGASTGTATATPTQVNPAPTSPAPAPTAAPVTPQNPAPVLTILAPTNAMAGGPAFTLAVNGSGFIPGSEVYWNGSNRPTSYVNAQQLTAQISAADIASPGGVSVSVVSPAPGGGASSASAFTIKVAGAKFALVANAGSNNVAVLSQNPSDGGLAATTPGTFSPYTMPGGSVETLALSPNRQFVYVTTQQLYFGPNTAAGTLVVSTIDASTGALTAVPGATYATGGAPGSLAMYPTGSFIYTANYATNDVSAFRVDQNSGTLTPVAGSPFAAGGVATSVAISPNGRFAVVPAVQSGINVFAIDASTGALTPVPGSPFFVNSAFLGGITFNASGTVMYVAGGTSASSSNLGAFLMNPTTGAIIPITGSPYNAQNYPSSVTLNAAGTFAYVPNSGSGDISVFAVDPNSGALAAISGSPFACAGSPKTVTMDPTGAYAYVTDLTANTIVVFAINATTGALTPLVSKTFSAQIYGPVSLTFF